MGRWLLGLGLLLSCWGVAEAGRKPYKTLEAVHPEKIRYPDGAPTSAEVELGRVLFFDPRLSGDGSQSCSSCHSPERGFSDGRLVAQGKGGADLARHSQTLYNVAWGAAFMWDGRAMSLEEQALIPLFSEVEMAQTEEGLLRTLRGIPGYGPLFQQVWPDGEISAQRVARAIASFERTLVVADTPFDRYMKGDVAALSDAERRGLELFVGKAGCETCHSGPHFSDQKFHNTGVLGDDLGRGGLDIIGEFSTTPYAFMNSYRAFKTPTLRNVALSAPYMHNGSVPTLEDAVDFYNSGGRHEDKMGRSRFVFPLSLSPQEKADLVAFMKSLTQEISVPRPALPQ